MPLCDASVNELADAVGMEPSSVSRHLGLVVGERAGRQVVYELHDDRVGELLTQAVARVEHVRLGLSGRTEAHQEVVV